MTVGTVVVAATREAIWVVRLAAYTVVYCAIIYYECYQANPVHEGK